MRIDNLSVVIPAFNEESRIFQTVSHLEDYLKENFSNFEIIVVDDGSSDLTASLLTKAAAKFSGIRILDNEANIGKGHSVRRGVLSSKGSFILTCDADLSAPIEEIEKLIPWLDDGFDIVIGSRGLKDSEIAERQPWYREKMGRIFNLFVRILIIGGIMDTQCGFKLFNVKSAREVFEKSRLNGFSYDVEILFISMLKGFKIKEVPIRWSHSPDSKVRLLKDSVRMFIDLLKIRFYHFYGNYK